MGLAVHISVAAMCCLLSACATGAQQEVQRQAAIYNDMKPLLEACTKSIDADPAYAPLRAKIPISSEQHASLQMLADKSKPTPWGEFNQARDAALAIGKEKLVEAEAKNKRRSPARARSRNGAASTSGRCLRSVERAAASDTTG